MKRKSILTVLLVAVLLLGVFPLAGCSPKEEDIRFISSTDELKQARIGVTTGAVFDVIAEKEFPDAKLQYFDTSADILSALDAGKIDAAFFDEPYAAQASGRNPSYTILSKMADDDYGFVFSKEDEKAKDLCDQFNKFLADCIQDGTVEELRDIWFGEDESKKTVDPDSLTAENGVLKFAVCCDGADPFTYMKNGKIIGYDVDLAARFCKAYGYGLKCDDYSFSGLLPAIAGGKADFAGSGLSITEERKEAVLFSDPVYHGGVVIVVKAPVPVYTSFEELNGKYAGVITGSITDSIIQKHITDSEFIYLNTAADLAVALDAGKIDYYSADEPVARYLVANHNRQTVLGILEEDHYGMIFDKKTARGKELCRQMNEFLAKGKSDGSIKKLIDVWLGDHTDTMTVDYESLPAENGVLKFALSTEIGAPYVYLQNGKYVGYEVAIAEAFCREYGYGIEFFDSNFSGIIAAVSSGRCDFGASGISITEERKESLLFSDPTYDGGVAVVVRNTGSSEVNELPFYQKIAESFDKTFLREGRWKLFLEGIVITVLITLVSAIFGSLLGFVFFLLYRKKNKIAVAFFNVIGDILEKMPVVVILMILYYILFGDSDISSMIVAMIGFTVLFAFGVLGLLKSAVGAVDRGQTEAALALGYTDRQGFLKMIFPQALKHFLPGYKSALVSLIKDTSIVGYIAVQDLTKVSDIVRSRTYEAFFPLIATAVIYFVIAFLLIHLVKAIEVNTDPRRRKAEKILKGVKTK